MIVFDHVSYTYPGSVVPALHHVSLSIAEGEFVLVAGASGTGKSTFLRTINGLVPHFYGGRFGGRVVVAGHDTRTHQPRDLAHVVGFVFQDPEAQMVVEIVEDEIVFGMENLGVDPRIMRRRVEEVLDQLEIAHLRRRHVATLSGGERQRVAIAAALAVQPHVLVLDEPTSQLDPHTAEEVLTALHKLNADLGLTIILSEHRLERVVQYADRLLIFQQQVGHLPTIVDGAPQDVLGRSPLAPPVVQLGKALGWQPLPLTIKDARRFVVGQGLDQGGPHPLPLSLHRREPVSYGGERGSQVPSRWRRGEGLLRIDDLSVELARQDIVYRVSLTAAHGELIAIMGRNGSGKTTLLRAIMGLVTPTQGRILLAERDITALPTEDRARSIGYVPQDPRTLLFHESVVDELRWTLRNLRPNDQHDEPIARTLSDLNITHLAQAHPRDLSGGEQQRAALAAILVAEPQVLLLDEPTRGLDYQAKALLIDLLRRLQDSGRTILLVTHDVELVAACADRVVLLSEGEVVVDGPPTEVLNDSLIFSSQIGKLFRQQHWLTVEDALRGLSRQEVK
jgi:energy-coupling factor transport system ATP-binding protein